MENKKVSPSTMLRWAKTKSAYREQKNVKDAKKFSDITPTKQRIIKEQYEKKIAKKKPAPKPAPKKPVRFIAGPKLPPRNDRGSGGTGKVNVLDDKKKLNMMDMISEYMKETGKIPKGANDPSFVKWMKGKLSK